MQNIPIDIAGTAERQFKGFLLGQGFGFTLYSDLLLKKSNKDFVQLLKYETSFHKQVDIMNIYYRADDAAREYYKRFIITMDIAESEVLPSHKIFLKIL